MNLLTKIFDYFIPKHHYAGLDPINKIDFLAKSRLSLSLCLFYLPVILLIAFIRLIYLGNESATLVPLFFVGIFCFIGIVILRLKGSYHFISAVFLISFLIILPYRTYYTGGMIAPNLTWYFTGLVIVGVLYNRVIFSLYSIMTLLFIILIHFINTPVYDSPVYIRLLIQFFGYTGTIFSIWAFFNHNNFLKKELISLEKLKTLNLLIVSLSDEINNPLTKAKGKIAKLHKKYQSKNPELDDIDGYLNRIADVVKQISTINDPDEIRTEPYRKIYEKLLLKESYSL